MSFNTNIMDGTLYQKTTLDNGLRVVTSTMPQTRSVSIGIFIGVGSRYETEAEAGVSHFIEHLCFKGTHRRPTARELSATIEGVGGILNGSTDKELTLYWSKIAKPHFALALDVLVDMLLNSRFDPQEIERERQVIVEELNMSLDSPAQRVDILIDELLWSDHPLGRDIAGTKETVTALTREMMIDYLKAQYQPGNTLIAIAGDIQHDEVVTICSRALGRWSSQPSRPGYLPYETHPARRLHIETRDIEQAHLCLALPGLSIFHPGRFVLDLLNIVLGEGMSSRLFTEIRDKLGLAYAISSCVDHFLDTGSVTIYAGVEPKKLKVAVRAILEQLSQLREIVPEAELSRAKELAKGRLLLRMEDSRNVALWLGAQEILTQRILSVDEVMSIIDAITAEELKQLAEELLISHELRLAVVGPVAKDEPLAEILKL